MSKMSRKNFYLNEILTSPLVLWIISITSAVLMWVYVTGMEQRAYMTRKFTCPLEYRNLDSQNILRGHVAEVEVEIRGAEEDIINLDYNNVNAYVDARNLAAGKRYTVNILVTTPPNITLVSCFPSQVVLDIVNRVTRLMNVETILPQNIPEGHYIEGVEIIPKEVGIKGAEDDVAKVGSVRITPTIEELEEGRELLMPPKLVQSEPFIGSVTIEPAQVRFKGNLVRGLPKKRVPVNVRLTGKLDSDYEVRSITTDPSEIQIEGNAEDLEKIEAIDTEVIDISFITSDQAIVAPLRRPEVEGVSIVSTPSVKLSLQLGEIHAEKRLSNVLVEPRKTNSANNFICNPTHVSVTIEGRPSLIEKVSVENSGIKAFVDMTNIFMTPITLPVQAEITSGDPFRITRIEPANVTINNNTD